MKSKKLLSTILALLLVLTSIPVFMLPVSAEGYEAYIGTTGYATFEEAVTAANAATEDVTIKLAANVSFTAQITVNNTNNKTVTIDGQDQYTISAYVVNGTSSTWSMVFKTPSVIQNVTIECYRGPEVKTTSFTLNNVTLTAGSDKGDAAMKISTTSTATDAQKVTVEDCTITTNRPTSGNCPCIAMYTNNPVTVDIIDSELNHTGAQTSSNNNASVIAVTKDNSNITDDATINLKGSTTLNYSPAAVPANKMVGVLRVNASCVGVFNIESTVTIINNNHGTNASANYNYFASVEGTCTINDSGAKWVVSKEALAVGVKLPSQKNYNQYKYTLNTEELKVNPDTVVQIANATADITFTHYSSGITEDSVCEINGQTGYATLGAALSAASDGDVITLLKNLTDASTKLTAKQGVASNVTINGNNKTISADFSDYIWSFQKGAIIKNLTITDAQLGFELAGGSMTVDGVNLTVDKDIAIKVSNPNDGSTTQSLTVKNSTITVNEGTANAPCIALYSNVPVTVDVTASTLSYYGKNTSSQNNASVLLSSTPPSATFNLNAGTVINYDPVGTPGSAVGALRVKTNSAVFNIDSDVTLNLSNGVSASNNNFFVSSSGTSCVVNDKGAKWVVSEDMATKGYAFSNVQTGVVGVINTATKALSTAKETLNTAATYKTLALTNVAGASVRTAGPIGIRFAANSNAVFNDSTLFEGATVTFGHIITTKEILATVNGDFSQLTDANAVKSVVTKWVDDAKTNYRSALVDIPQTAAAMQKNFAATAYVTITIGGNSVTYYAAYNETDNCRSIYNVAKAAVATDEYKDNATLKAIVNLVEASTQALSFTDKTADGVYAISDTTEQIVYTGFTASDLLAYESNAKKNLI